MKESLWIPAEISGRVSAKITKQNHQTSSGEFFRDIAWKKNIEESLKDFSNQPMEEFRKEPPDYFGNGNGLSIHEFQRRSHTLSVPLGWYSDF